jgi:hypothetical protein
MTDWQVVGGFTSKPRCSWHELLMWLAALLLRIAALEARDG